VNGERRNDYVEDEHDEEDEKRLMRLAAPCAGER
jgi:hypothetical protein